VRACCYACVLVHRTCRSAKVETLGLIIVNFSDSDDDLGETEEMMELRAEHRRLARQAQRSKSRAQELYARTALYNKVSVEWPTQQRRQGAQA
jgi:hypothetical protein